MIKKKYFENLSIIDNYQAICYHNRHWIYFQVYIMNLFFFLLKQSDNIKTLGRVKYSYLSWRIVVLLLSNHSNTYTVWSELYDTCIKIENNTFLSLTTPTAKCEWFVSAWQRDEMALFIFRLAKLLITVLILWGKKVSYKVELIS